MSYGAEQPLSEAGLRICRVVSEQPGIHFRGLARAATLPAGQLRHHLDRLVRRGILVELEDGGYKRFFLAGKHDPRLRPALALFARRVPRRIGSLLLMRPMTRTELRRHLGCGDSTLGFHLARMVQAQVVTKQRDRSGCRYALAEPALARQALSMRSAGSPVEERLPDPPHEAWELRPPREPPPAREPIAGFPPPSGPGLMEDLPPDDVPSELVEPIAPLGPAADAMGVADDPELPLREPGDEPPRPPERGPALPP
jgi:DNA-binding MarR family transcriptional regulator